MRTHSLIALARNVRMQCRIVHRKHMTHARGKKKCPQKFKLEINTFFTCPAPITTILLLCDISHTKLRHCVNAHLADKSHALVARYNIECTNMQFMFVIWLGYTSSAGCTLNAMCAAVWRTKV